MLGVSSVDEASLVYLEMFAALRPDVWPALSGRERKGVNMKLTRSGLLALSKDALISSSVKQRPFFGVLQRSSSLLLSNAAVRICFAVFSKALVLPGSPEEFLPKPGETWGKRW
jgi:hypothetical protein